MKKIRNEIVFSKKVEGENMKIFYKYEPKTITKIIYIMLICIGLLLTIGRWYSVVNNDFVLFSKEIQSHISNLSLSMIVYLGIGYTWLLMGQKFRIVVVLGIFLIVANLVCETLILFLNTPDIIDFVYGVIGIGIAFIFLFFCNKYGFKKIK